MNLRYASALLAVLAPLSFAASASALECETNTPVDKQDAVNIKIAAFNENKPTNLDGTANCDTLSTAAINAALDEKADKTYVDEQNGLQDDEIEKKADKDYVDSKNDAQDDEIKKKASKKYVDFKNHQQDKEIGKKADKTYVDNQNNAQNTKIDTNTKTNTTQDTRLNGHDTLLNNHAKLLDDHSKGLAISMALPDVWLGESKKFGIFGGFGGFNGETALGFGVIGRVDETWTVNGKFGADTSFDEIGWQVGAGAQW